MVKNTEGTAVEIAEIRGDIKLIAHQMTQFVATCQELAESVKEVNKKVDDKASADELEALKNKQTEVEARINGFRSFVLGMCFVFSAAATGAVSLIKKLPVLL